MDPRNTRFSTLADYFLRRLSRLLTLLDLGFTSLDNACRRVSFRQWKRRRRINRSTFHRRKFVRVFLGSTTSGKSSSSVTSISRGLIECEGEGYENEGASELEIWEKCKTWEIIDVGNTFYQKLEIYKMSDFCSFWNIDSEDLKIFMKNARLLKISIF